MTFHRIGVVATLMALACIVFGCQPMTVTGWGMAPGPESTNLRTAATPYEAIQRAINEANVDITAAARVLNQNARAGVISKSDAATFRQTLKESAQSVDVAQDILREGDTDSARSHLDLAQVLILRARREIDQQSRKEAKQ
ncbi:MAG TPA: hypothetical protein PKZ07_19325 [Sedimentisphaerales bacterium]|nr:hypothetical protein [Sedimentisphaerales bacterium]